MFGFLRRKMTVDDLARSFSAVDVKILNSASHPKYEDRLDQYVAAGAEPRCLNYELGALASFCVWAGAVRATQRGKMTTAEFELFMAAYMEQMAEAVVELGLDPMCRLNRGMSCMDFLHERLNELTTITVETEPSLVLSAIVDAVCCSFGRENPSAKLKQMVETEYLFISETAFNIVSRTKLAKAT